MTFDSRNIRRVGVVAIAPLLLAASPTGRSTTADGIAMTVKQSSTARGFQANTMQVRVLGQRARIDYQKAQPGMTAGSWILLDSEKAQMTLVSPREKEATIFPVGGMAAMLGAFGAAGVMKAEVSDVVVEAADAGSGEAVLGHPTHRHVVTQAYSIRVSVMGIRREMKINSSTVVWAATDVPPTETKALEEYSRNFANAMGGMGGFGGDGMRKLQDEIIRKMPGGVHLKTVTTSVQVDQGGKADTSTTTQEVTEFKRTSLDARLFEIPEGYTISDLSTAIADAEKRKAECEKEKGVGKCEDLPEVNYDSIKKAAYDSAASDTRRGIGNSALDAAGLGAVRGLGGLFGKKAPADTTKKPPADSAKKKPPQQ